MTSAIFTCSSSGGGGSWTILPSSAKLTTLLSPVGGPLASSSLPGYLKTQTPPCSCSRLGILEIASGGRLVRATVTEFHAYIHQKLKNSKKNLDVPGNAFTHSLLNTPYDWQYHTVPQPKAGNRAIYWPRGKVLGGSSAVNGLFLVRPSKIEYDAWSDLMQSQDNGAGAKAWSWDRHYPFMKKSETFNPPTSDIQTAANIAFNQDSHGNNGPIHASYPG